MRSPGAIYILQYSCPPIGMAGETYMVLEKCSWVQRYRKYSPWQLEVGWSILSVQVM